VQDYGKVEDEGTPGYHSARIGLRAPWVAVRVETRDDWLSMFALAMSMASGLRGAYGFIYVPRQTGELHPALARILSAYDPDYLVDALLTHGDVEALEPGWLARNYEAWPADPDEAAARIAPLLDEAVRNGLGEDIGANLCSPFHDRDKFRRMRVLSRRSQGAAPSLTTVLGTQQATLEVPDGLDAQLTLALGLRAGYPGKPPLPLGREINGVAERLPHRYVSYALSTRPNGGGLGFQSLTSAWSLTQLGLVQVTKGWLGARPVAVVGSAAEDFALAVALDRMYGTTIWVPVEWTQNPDLRWPVQQSYRDLVEAARRSDHLPIVTSISLSEERFKAAVRASWPEPIQAWLSDSNPQSLSGYPFEVVPAEQLDLRVPRPR